MASTLVGTMRRQAGKWRRIFMSIFFLAGKAMVAAPCTRLSIIRVICRWQIWRNYFDMTILVCGGAGFMGANFIRHILTTYTDYRVVNFDKLTYAGNLDNLKDVEHNSRYTFVHGDICSRANLEEVVQQYAIDTIVNYAAETHVDRSITDPEPFLHTDVLGTFQLLQLTKKYRLKKMVQISTDEVYGSIAEGKFTEESCFLPNSPYSASKAGADLLCRSYVATYGAPVVVTHSCNVYGPYQYPEKIIPLFITNLIEDKKVPLYGDGLQAREWIYVADHCRAIDLILHNSQPGSVYNIGTGDELTNLELTRLLVGLIGKGEEMIEKIVDRPGHDRRYAIDCNKIQSELGWKPMVNFAYGINDTVNWYKKNEDWWKKIKNAEYGEHYKQQYQENK